MELLELENGVLVEKSYPNSTERKSFLIIADKCGYKDKIPTIRNERSLSSIAGYTKRFTNWKNKLMIAYNAMIQYNSSKHVLVR